MLTKRRHGVPHEPPPRTLPASTIARRVPEAYNGSPGDALNSSHGENQLALHKSNGHSKAVRDTRTMNLSDRRSLEVSRAVVRELDRNPDAVQNKG